MAVEHVALVAGDGLYKVAQRLIGPGWSVEQVTLVVQHLMAANRIELKTPVFPGTVLHYDPAKIPTPAPPAPPATYGSLPVGQARYAPKATAVYVDPINGNDANTGAITAPFRTINAAARKAVDQVVLRAGVYYETVAGWGKNGITIQGYPGEAAWLDGSQVVTGWTKVGNVWHRTGWTVTHDRGSSFSPRSSDQSWNSTENPCASWPDAIWLAGVELRQVRTEAEVVAGTFCVNYDAQRIVLGSDPTGKEVRAAVLERAWLSTNDDSVLRGVGVRKYATPCSTLGAVRGVRRRNHVEHVVFEDISSIGASFGDDYDGGDCSVRYVTTRRCGLNGIHGNNADRFLVEHCDIGLSNSRRFKLAPTAGGVKVTRSRDVAIRHNLLEGNLAIGIWLDETVVGFEVVGNVSRDGAAKADILVELCEDGIVAGNEIAGRGRAEFCIWVFDCGQVKVYNNAVGGATIADIQLKGDERRHDTWHTARDPRYPTAAQSGTTWELRLVDVANNIRRAGGPRGMLVQDVNPTAAARLNLLEQALLIRNNVWQLAVGDVIVRWGNEGQMMGIRTVADLVALDAHNVGNTIAAAGTFTVDHSKALPIPADVAAALGVPAGTKHFGPI